MSVPEGKGTGRLILKGAEGGEGELPKRRCSQTQHFKDRKYQKAPLVDKEVTDLILKAARRPELP